RTPPSPLLTLSLHDALPISFAFFSYEGYRLRTGTPFLTTVPTALERTGDFSDLCPTGFTAGLCNDGIHQIYDPLTTPRQPFLNRSEEHTSELQSRGHLVCRL